ncbi:MAG: ribosome biogenesis GTP-binding protein YihA/YsxC [Rhizomicrobium sp.]
MSDDSVPTARETERIRKMFAGPCDFVAGAANIDAIPSPSLPEMAFVGRSNVGKSSLINALTGRNSLARTSNTPGATKQINFFRLGNACLLVDLPGYGYARISKEAAEQWRGLIFDYIRGRPTLRRVLLLIDARRGAMEADHEAMKQLDQAAVSYVVVLTKIDTLPASGRDAAVQRCLTELRGHAAAYPDVLSTSSETGQGLDMLKAHLAALARP